VPYGISPVVGENGTAGTGVVRPGGRSPVAKDRYGRFRVMELTGVRFSYVQSSWKRVS